MYIRQQINQQLSGCPINCFSNLIKKIIITLPYYTSLSRSNFSLVVTAGQARDLIIKFLFKNEAYGK